MHKERGRAGRTLPAAWSALVGALLGIGVVAAGCTSGGTGETLGAGDASADVTADVTMEAASCPTGQSMCGTSCADTTKDPDNCGSCGNACAAGQVCSMGTCALSCAGGATQCGQSCVQTSVDPQNCGGCGKACGASEACVGGSCKTQCPTGQTVCRADGGTYCASFSNDSNNCGGCGIACAAGQVCSGGTCGISCQPSETLCTSDAGAGDAGAGAPYCANTQTDNANCGACGDVCPQGQVCTQGACTTSCQPNETLCTPDGGAAYCATTATDNANCGTCGNACGTGQACSNGKCTADCGAGETLCTPDGGAPYCAITASDNANCGTCGNTCPPGQVCSNSQCTTPFTVAYVYETAANYIGGNIGSRSASTAQCQADYAAYSGQVSCSHFVALLGYAADNGVQDLPTTYGVPTSVPIKSVSGTTYAANFSSLITNTPPLMSGTGFSTWHAWTGFTEGGGLVAGQNCSDWTTTTANTAGANAYFLNNLNDNWNNGNSNCTLSLTAEPYLCLCW